MIPLLALIQAAAPVLGTLDRQALPVRGCAAYLWSRADRQFAAVAGSDPAILRLKVDGRVVEMARVAQAGQAGLGLPVQGTYEAAGLSATVTMTIAPRDDLTRGAIVPEATLTLRRAGADELIQPLAGLVGCAAESGS